MSAEAVAARSPAVVPRELYRRLLRVPARKVWTVAFAAPVLVLPAAAVPGLLAPAVLGLVLVAAVVTDLMWRRILNAGTASGFTWLAGLHALAAAGLIDANQHGLLPFGDAVHGGILCLGASLALYLLFRGGEGDVKLLALIGFAVGGWHGTEALVAGYLFAAAAAVLLIAGRVTTRRPGPMLAGTLPMAPFFAAGVVYTLTAR